jgi:Kef-type K+ transport system membrane component KefB
MRFYAGHAVLELFIAVAVATMLGVGGRFMLRRAERSRPEALAVFIGIVALSAGVAADLRFSPLLGSMLVGLVASNLAGPRVRDFERFILGAEHTVALMFFLLAGVLLEPTIGLWGAALALLLVALRLMLKPLVMSYSLAIHADELPLRSALYAATIRQSPVAIAIAVGVVLAEASMFNRQILTIVVLSGLISEFWPFFLSQIMRRQSRIERKPVAEPEAAT